MQHVFIVGAKSIGAYGGYETFVHKLIEYHNGQESIKYHIACKANGNGCMDENSLENVTKVANDEFLYQNAHCFKIKVPNIGSVQAIYYDVKALKYCCSYIKSNNINAPIIYILACRVGPFIRYFYKRIHKLGGKIYVNPDGHEWMRAKWSRPIQRYWKCSEQMMIKNCDLVVCDSLNIERYIHDNYEKKVEDLQTVYLAYGAETKRSILDDNSIEFTKWLLNYKLEIDSYYLTVGRFVPENNYEIMISEFMMSNSQRDFVIIANVNQSLLNQLEKKLDYKNDKRIKFVGTVYNQELLKKIRENAYGYFHGHEVGGTNPSLLEALASTKLNMLLKVSFNIEVANDSALYWEKKEGDLRRLINNVDMMTVEERSVLGQKAKKRIAEQYSWQYICDEYKKLFES